MQYIKTLYQKWRRKTELPLNMQCSPSVIPPYVKASPKRDPSFCDFPDLDKSLDGVIAQFCDD